MSCPLAFISTPPSPSALKPQMTLSFNTPPRPQSPVALRRTFITPASPCEAMPSIATKPKSKPQLAKGCSLLDWIRLCKRRKAEFSCNGGTPRGITEEELSRHNTQEDAWTAVRGKVYNITPYMKFHPGGVGDLMQAAGKDSTIIFDEVHKWVNIESMLKFCFVGPLVPDSPSTARRNSQKIADAAKQRSNLTTTLGAGSSVSLKSALLRAATQAAVACEEPDGVKQDSPESPVKLFVPPVLKRPPMSADRQEAQENSGVLTVPEARNRKNSDVTKPYPKFDWVQSEKTINLRVITQMQNVKCSDVIIDLNGKKFEASIFINEWVYELDIELEQAVVSSQVSVNGNRVEISLKKQESQELWGSIGTFNPGHLTLHPKNARETKYHPTTVEAITAVSHDSKIFRLSIPAGSYLNVPTGHHLSVRAEVNGESVRRSYTPVCSSDDLTRHPGPASSEGRSIDLMVKLYQDGKMSQHLSSLSIGDELWVSDPDGTFNSSRVAENNLLLIAAGSGFTPMVKVLRDFLHLGREDLTDNAGSSVSEPRAKLLFANKTEKDIWWKDELDGLAKSEQKRFELLHVLSDTKEDPIPASGVKGRIDSTLLKKYLPTDNEERNKTLICICGSLPFTTAISSCLLDEEFPDECVHCFT